jgi:hypothetical protein
VGGSRCFLFNCSFVFVAALCTSREGVYIPVFLVPFLLVCAFADHVYHHFRRGVVRLWLHLQYATSYLQDLSFL